MGHKPQQPILGIQQGSSLNRFDRSVLAQIYNCLASNWKAPVLAMGLACLTAYWSPDLFAFADCCSPFIYSTLTGTIPISSCLDWQMTRTLLLFVCHCMGQAGTPVWSRMCAPMEKRKLQSVYGHGYVHIQQVHPERIVEQAKTRIGTGTTQNVRTRISWSFCGLRKVIVSMTLKILLYCIYDNIINIFKLIMTREHSSTGHLCLSSCVCTSFLTTKSQGQLQSSSRRI